MTNRPLDVAALSPTTEFVNRHLGSDDNDISSMLATLGLRSLDELSDAAIPANIRLSRGLEMPQPATETAALEELRCTLANNRIRRSFIGLGYAPAILPTVIQRNILENPGWYTQYTPYQAEIAQGRLEALLNYQTMITELTGLPLANASLLDEATAAAEAMTMCRLAQRGNSARFVIDAGCLPQTIDVVRTRAAAIGVEVIVADLSNVDFNSLTPFAVLIQYPNRNGALSSPKSVIQSAHAAGAAVVMATCPLALAVLASPGDLGADIAVGSTQRFGLPMAFGGPHAAFLAARTEFKRLLPGRVVGVSKDTSGNIAYRLALQTREQHIRRERATSNICTAQVLPAVVASFYAVYHGPAGLVAIATRIARLTYVLTAGLTQLGLEVANRDAFDTQRVHLDCEQRSRVLDTACRLGIELASDRDDSLGVTLDEPTTLSEVDRLLEAFGAATGRRIETADIEVDDSTLVPESLRRTTAFMTQSVFQRFHSEHELLRYMRRLESRDLSLTTSMIPLGSCTMKLNPTSAMLPISWPEISSIHPATDPKNAQGILTVIRNLEQWLAEIAGMDAVSVQPNSGAQGEFAGLLVIRAYLRSIGQEHRNVCLIPVSAHGTNPASAALSGMRVVVVSCDSKGNVDRQDLKTKAEAHAGNLAALMVTYPSTHGVFESDIRELCEIVHAAGGQVYLDGANMNAQVGLCRPGDYGAD
ncbi:MAG TPA: aminomethyl-transferring glycine dehydrogenase, partial [Polyangiaceae bacterium]